MCLMGWIVRASQRFGLPAAPDEPRITIFLRSAVPLAEWTL